MLLVFCAAVLLVVRTLPSTPPHDGIRLFLPAFPFVAALIGLGADRAFVWLSTRYGRRRGGLSLAVAAVGSLYLAAATSLVWYSPHWLSYYNLAIGGLPGATAVGMEPTYYWDGLDQGMLKWLQKNTPSKDKVRFASGPRENLGLLRGWGRFKRRYRLKHHGSFRWYVLQYRPGLWSPADRWLFEHETPVRTKTIRRGGYGPWRLDVPLVMVYPYCRYVEALERVPRTGVATLPSASRPSGKTKS